MYILFQIHKIIGFAPSLLQVIMLPDVDMPVRQAGKFLFPKYKFYQICSKLIAKCS